jgi:FixJ family two-component response regulator
MTTAGNILLADDEDLFRTSTAALLRSDGFTCDCVENGPQAVELLQKYRYDVLIADICMEGNNDLALVRDTGRIVPGLPVILVTGHPSLETAIPSIHLAVIAYLRKPVDYVQIREQVRRATEHSAIHRTMTEIHRRLTAAAAEFAALQGQCSPHSDPSHLIPISLVRDVSSALTDILSLRAALGCQDGQQSLCSLLDCRIHPNYEDAIAETIEVLQRTKSSFKSKELGALRFRLESILENPHSLPRPHISCATISQRQS